MVVLVGLVYVFNLIVGTGALAIPKAFGLAGWLVSTIVVILLAIFRQVQNFAIGYFSDRVHC